jgi:hypothetical protein
MIEAKQRAIHGPRETHRQRKARWREIRRLNAELQGFIEDPRSDLKARLHVLQERLRDNRVATNREYSLVLHSRRRLSAVMARLKADVDAG